MYCIPKDNASIKGAMKDREKIVMDSQSKKVVPSLRNSHGGASVGGRSKEESSEASDEEGENHGPARG